MLSFRSLVNDVRPNNLEDHPNHPSAEEIYDAAISGIAPQFGDLPTRLTKWDDPRSSLRRPEKWKNVSRTVKSPAGLPDIYPTVFVLSGWWFFATPLKNDGVKVSWDDVTIPNIWKNEIHVPNHPPIMFLLLDIPQSAIRLTSDLLPQN